VRWLPSFKIRIGCPPRFADIVSPTGARNVGL
jgi:hypothetical protein